MSNPKLPTGFALLWTIRDARLVRNAENQLVMALAMRCNPTKGYTCFPSYSLLAKDTGCNINTLKKAAAELERKGLIRRRTRKSKANVFAICVDQFLEPAAIQRAADRAEKEEFEDDNDPEPLENATPQDASRDAAKKHLHLDSETLKTFLDTGVLNLSESDKEYLGILKFSDNPGSFFGRQLDASNRWSNMVPNAAPDGTCPTCLGTTRICITLVDNKGNTCTVEKDQPCSDCQPAVFTLR
jgi:DNA-binding MarR family transcriptional regulator